MNTNPDALKIRAFSAPIKVEGKTYYDTHSRVFSVIRLPAIMKYLYPALQKERLCFEIRCFPTKESLLEYLDACDDLPFTVNLYIRRDDS